MFGHKVYNYGRHLFNSVWPQTVMKWQSPNCSYLLCNSIPSFRMAQEAGRVQLKWVKQLTELSLSLLFNVCMGYIKLLRDKINNVSSNLAKMWTLCRKYQLLERRRERKVEADKQYIYIYIYCTEDSHGHGSSLMF